MKMIVACAFCCGLWGTMHGMVCQLVPLSRYATMPAVKLDDCENSTGWQLSRCSWMLYYLISKAGLLQRRHFDVARREDIKALFLRLNNLAGQSRNAVMARSCELGDHLDAHELYIWLCQRSERLMNDLKLTQYLTPYPVIQKRESYALLLLNEGSY
jgi:hypothetical protein